MTEDLELEDDPGYVAPVVPVVTPADHRDQIEALVPEPPAGWSEPRELLVVGRYVHLRRPGAPSPGPGVEPVHESLQTLLDRGLRPAPEINTLLSDSERRHLRYVTLIEPLVDRSLALSEALDRGEPLDERALSATFAAWAAAEAEVARRSHTRPAAGFLGNSFHLYNRIGFIEGDGLAHDPYIHTRRVQGYAIDHVDAPDDPLLLAVRRLIDSFQTRGATFWDPEHVAFDAAVLGAFFVGSLIPADDKKTRRSHAALQQQVCVALRTGQSPEAILDRAADQEAGDPKAAAEYAVLRRLVASASVWARQRLEAETETEFGRWSRPVVEVRFPSRPMAQGDEPTFFTDDEMTAGLVCTGWTHPVALKAMVVLAQAWSVEFRTTRMRSWDDGVNWVEPPSDDWAPKKKHHKPYLTDHVLTATLTAHGLGTRAVFDGLDATLPEGFYGGRSLCHGPGRPPPLTLTQAG